MINTSIKYTVRDYMSIPDGDERRFELIDGELMLAPAPVPTHQMIVIDCCTYSKSSWNDTVWVKCSSRQLMWCWPSTIYSSRTFCSYPPIDFI